MSDEDQNELFSLALFGSIEGIGRRTLRKLQKYRRERDWQWRAIWVPSEEVISFLSLSDKQVSAIKNTNTEHITDSLQTALDTNGVRLVNAESEEYPPLLCETDDPPVVLFVKGEKMRWEAGVIPIAVVGTRNMTPYGRLATEKITTELVELGSVIISGLMYGVDSTAHLSALQAGGQTIAVLGYGFDHCYPVDHQPVFDDLLARGATFISEYPPWQRASKGNFPARNSIVAGMSSAVVVTEAAAKSGSLITAQLALEEGRAVCAVPGPITNPYCEGTKWLVNEGAVLVSHGSEVLEQVWGPSNLSANRIERTVRHDAKTGTKPFPLSQYETLGPVAKQIVAALSAQVLSVESLGQMVPVAPEVLASELSLLEINGVICTISNTVSLVSQ